MSALNLVLTYSALPVPTLTATFYNPDGTPANLVPPAFSGNYTFVINGVPLGPFLAQPSTASVFVTPLPVTCPAVYSVTVVYTLAGGLPITATDTLIVTGSNYVIGDYLVQTSIPGGISLSLNALGLTPTNIVLTKNGVVIPGATFPFIATGNGVYQVSFVSGGVTYISTTQVIGSSPAAFITITGNDLVLYGALGVPQSVTSLTFADFGLTSNVSNRIYVNGIQVSDGNRISLVGLLPGDVITIVSVDRCLGTVVTASTVILSCSIPLPPTPIPQ